MRWNRPRKNVYDWNLWFAWHPVRVLTGEMVWLEWCYRKVVGMGLRTGPEWNYTAYNGE